MTDRFHSHSVDLDEKTFTFSRELSTAVLHFTLSGSTHPPLHRSFSELHETRRGEQRILRLCAILHA